MWWKVVLCLSIPNLFAGCNIAYYGAHNLINEPAQTINQFKLRQRMRAEGRAAWEDECRLHPPGTYSREYEKGFIAGYADYLDNGGVPGPPAAPPARYRRHANDFTPEGQAGQDDYLTGFGRGSEVAAAKGHRQSVLVPLYVPAPHPESPLNITCVPASLEPRVLPNPPIVVPPMFPPEPPGIPGPRPVPVPPAIPVKPLPVPPPNPATPLPVPPAIPAKPLSIPPVIPAPKPLPVPEPVAPDPPAESKGPGTAPSELPGSYLPTVPTVPKPIPLSQLPTSRPEPARGGSYVIEPVTGQWLPCERSPELVIERVLPPVSSPP